MKFSAFERNHGFVFEQIISILNDHLPIEICNYVFRFLDLYYTFEILGANINQLCYLAKLMSFKDIGNPRGYRIQGDGSRLYFDDPAVWFICDPVFFKI